MRRAASSALWTWSTLIDPEQAERLESLGYEPPCRFSAQLPGGAGSRVLLVFQPMA